jgi:hypothetical protein
MKFKMDIIWVRIIILKNYNMQDYMACGSDNLLIIGWYDSW